MSIELRDWTGDVKWTGRVGEDGDTIDVDLTNLQRFVFENLKPDAGEPGIGHEPRAYRVSLNQTVEEAGAGAAWGEVVVAVQEWSGMVAWSVLGGMIANFLTSKDRE